MFALGDGMSWDYQRTESGVIASAFEITLPGTPVSQNARERGHWGEIRRHDVSWRDATVRLMREAMTRSGADLDQIGAPWPAADIEFVFRFAKAGRRDVANFIGGAKPLVDALLQPGPIGLLVDDSYRYLDSVTARIQRHLEPQPSTILRITRCRHAWTTP